ncbi:MAG: hypothetical protein K1X92_04195 [Bacteroidia bacterium]|nr:hypothetical protein [Bacteroidia bacterium]
MKKGISFCLLIAGLFTITFAQQGFGFRFASHFNHFPNQEEFDLIPNWFSSGQVGGFYRSYNAYGGAEVGLSINYKRTKDGKGFPNLPLVMQDFPAKDQLGNSVRSDVGMTSLELDMRLGPRFGAVNPKIGYILGYRLNQQNIIDPTNVNPDTVRLNRVYLGLPFGATVDFFTGFGTIGIGAFYNIGLLNVRHKPENWTCGDFSCGFYPGGKWNSVSLEMTVTFNSGDQKNYFNPDIERDKRRRNKKVVPETESESDE